MKNITTFDLEQLEKFKKIYVLVSGGIDSTYLLELINEKFPTKTYAVNCYNPYEYSKTLRRIEKKHKYISITPNKKYIQREVLRNAFLKIDYLKKSGKKYSKKYFGCCRIFKHQMFKKDKRFTEEGTVIVSGIKYGDGNQRRLFLHQLQDGQARIGSTNTDNNYTGGANPTFFHKHKWGAVYCYPFRDYKKVNLPEEIVDELKEMYPNLDHSGCIICPVVYMYRHKIKNPTQKQKIQIENSIRYYNFLKGKKMDVVNGEEVFYEEDDFDWET
jgi:hypothetical protein